MAGNEELKGTTTIRVSRDKLEEIKRISKEERWPIQVIVDAWLEVFGEEPDQLFKKVILPKLKDKKQ